MSLRHPPGAGQGVDGKSEKYRETPLRTELAATLEAYVDVRDSAPFTPLVDKSARTIERWVSRAAERRQAETDDGAGSASA